MLEELTFISEELLDLISEEDEFALLLLVFDDEDTSELEDVSELDDTFSDELDFALLLELGGVQEPTRQLYSSRL